jgi:hypothetical protein
MKRSLILLMQFLIVVAGVGLLTLLLWEPHLEGRNATATLFQIYFNDPFLAYIYLVFVPVFIALYQAFKIAGHAGQSNVLSLATAKALRTIKYCALTTAGGMVGAVVYILAVVRAVEEDIAGGVAIGLFIILVSLAFAGIAAWFERMVQRQANLKSVSLS